MFNLIILKHKILTMLVWKDEIDLFLKYKG